MKVVIRGMLVAEAPSEELIEIEGNQYFPPSSIVPGALVDSPTPYTCPWKGVCQYHSAVVAGETVADAGWSYPEPYPAAFERVGADFSGYVAFDKRLVEFEPDA